MNLLLTDHIVEFVCIDTGRIDHIAGLVNTAGGFQLPAALDLPDILYFRVEPEVHSVGKGSLRHGDIHVKGADDAGCGCIEHTCHFLGKIRL